MPPFGILHLSDLQFGNKRSIVSRNEGGAILARDDVPQLLVHTLPAQDMTAPAVVVISGDIAEKGKSAEYEAAYSFITTLARHLKDRFGSLPIFVVVPGNHDVDRSESERHVDRPAQREAMLRAFRIFVTKLRVSGRLMVHAPDTGPDTSTLNIPLPTSDTAVIIVPLDSCEAEGHEPRQHHGHISGEQLDLVERAIASYVQPWAFQIAVFHHNVVINGLRPSELTSSFREELRRENLLSSAPERVEALAEGLASNATNTLIEPERVLERLARMGFQLVLHGHQHYDGPIHLQLPMRDHNPFGHDGMTIMAAGSAGIGAGPDQPSVTSAQYYLIAKRNFGWSIESTRIRIRSEGDRAPTVAVEVDSTLQWQCYSVRPRRILDGLCELFGRVQSKGKAAGTVAGTASAKDPATARLDTCLAWGRSFRGNVPDGPAFGWETNRFKWRLGQVRRLNTTDDGMAELIIGGVTDLLRKQKVYADLPNWQLLAGRDDGEAVELTVAKGSYLQYVIANTQLETPSGARLQKELHNRFTPVTNDWEALNRGLAWAASRISTRLTLQVLVETQDENGHPVVLLRQRSHNVSHFPGRIQFTVGGGFKCDLSGERGAESPALARAILAETELETGIRLHERSLRVVSLTLSTEELSPIICAVAHVDPETLKIKESRSAKIPPHIPQKYLLSDKCWVPDPLPRDWWEGTGLVKVALGASLNAVDELEAKKAWLALKEIYEFGSLVKPRSIDIPSWSAVAAVLK